jgi:Tfp pilus assembly protein PilN
MISINFASKNYRLIERVRIIVLAGIVIFCMTLAGMIWADVSLRMSSSRMDLKLKELEASLEQARPMLREREQLVKDFSAMTGLMEAKNFSWTRLLTNIEAVVPKGVALNKVGFNPKDHALTLEGRAHTPESLRTLVERLEKSSSFKDPFLKHQSIDKGSISFNVVAVYREDASPAVAQAK